MKNQRLAERKQELKEIALDIREDKRKYGWPACRSEEYRFKHIAYCMARGRKYEEIERKTHEHKKISKYQWEKLNSDISYLQEGFNEDVRSCS